MSEKLSATNTQTYIVHVQNDLKPEEFSSVGEWYTTSLIKQAKPTDFLYVYKSVFHGFSARLTPQQVQKLEQSPEVLGIFPDTVYQLHTTRSPLFLGLTTTTVAGSSLYDGNVSVTKLPVIHARDATKSVSNCFVDSLIEDLVRGKIVVCSGGGNSVGEKEMEVKRAGGAGIVVLGGSPDYAFLTPGLFVTNTQAQEALLRYMYENSSRILRGTMVFRGTQIGSSRTEVFVRRTVTHVSDGPAAYTATIRDPEAVTITVDPPKLVFSKIYERQSYVLRILASEAVPVGVIRTEFGQVTWTDGKHQVTSPILLNW
ncbi:hypothetical protein HS088_TW15G00052 [Tripterygium wilfordii]|uniref:Uncharacterized protein n=1 Tax=Tripterygium wilfordii TaxID=458696 RepID=A0A7J7CKI1_TRIWF|nr:hypothetical protein HS088_TW15G00052 [Tripterygium wilfordii]